MSQHNIVGSEAFETERHVRIRAYRRHVKRWRGYLIAAGLGGGLVITLAGLAAYFGSMLAR